MAFYDTVWYVNFGNGSTTGYYAVPQWAASTATPPGTFRRQKTTPAVGSERVYVAIQATTVNTGTTEPSWTTTRGAKQATDNGVLWQECTGAAGANGDSVNTPTWTAAHGISTAVSQGAIITDNNNVSFQICSVAGSMTVNVNTPPTFNTTLGGTTTDNSVTWVCIGLTASMPDWSAPHARLGNAFASTWGVAGNDFYIADNSAETSTAAIAASGPGTIAAPSRILSIDHTVTLPAGPSGLKPGASLTSSLSTGQSVSVGTGQGSSYYYGINFIASGTYTSSAIIGMATGGTARYRFENCTFQLTSNTSGANIQLVGQSSQLELINCTFNFANAGQFIQIGGLLFIWRNTPDPCFTGTIPTTALRSMSSLSGLAWIDGVDFTSLGANTLISTATTGVWFTIKNCKLHSGAIVAAEATTFATANVDVVNSDTGTTVTRNERHNVFGDLTTSTAVYRSGGAQDASVPVSHYAVSSTYAHSWRPFESLPLVIWNTKVGTPSTVTVYGIILGSTALPYNDQFWLDIEYMGSTGTPIASFSSNGLANQLTTHSVVAVADSTSTWTGAGTTNAPFSLSVSFTAQQQGYFTIYPRVGASFSVYIDPRPVLS